MPPRAPHGRTKPWVSRGGATEGGGFWCYSVAGELVGDSLRREGGRGYTSNRVGGIRDMASSSRDRDRWRVRGGMATCHLVGSVDCRSGHREGRGSVMGAAWPKGARGGNRPIKDKRTWIVSRRGAWDRRITGDGCVPPSVQRRSGTSGWWMVDGGSRRCGRRSETPTHFRWHRWRQLTALPFLPGDGTCHDDLASSTSQPTKSNQAAIFVPLFLPQLTT